MDVIRKLTVVDIGIDTHQESVVYMREDCHVCRAEGFNANSRVELKTESKSLIASFNVVDKRILQQGHVGLSKIALRRLEVSPGEDVIIGHAPVLESLSSVRKKVYGHALNQADFQNIVADIRDHKYSDIEVASFLSICTGGRLNLDEIIYLTRAMVNSGKQLTWPGNQAVYDKHCIGGLPGNRTTPLVVSIASAAGLTIPKTSSRAITSPAGTADTMETLTNVNLQLEDIQRTVAETGACLAWGGAVNMSPVDDIFIGIERALDLDGEGQLIASVLSKKIAAGSTHAVIDIPVGDTAKVRTSAEADRLTYLFTQVGNVCGIQVRCVKTDGSKPIGAGIGPVEEARDLLAVLQRSPSAPTDLRQRALLLAAHLIDLAENEGFEPALQKATAILDSGHAWLQFQRIAAAQGGLKTLFEARYQHVEETTAAGTITAIDNRKLARFAKLAGAPFDASAGLRLHHNVGETVQKGEPLFTLFADSEGERDYALSYYRNNPDMFTLREAK